MHALPVWSTIEDAFRFVWSERRDFVALATLPVVVLAILAVVLAIFLPSSDAELRQLAEGETEAAFPALTLGQSAAVFVNAVASIALYATFAVAWYRKLLVPGESTTVGAALRWGRKQTRFLVLWLLVSVLASLPVMLVALTTALTATPGALAFSPPLLIGALVGGFYVYGRIVPVLPAAAVDRTLGIPACWQLTKGKGWRLLAITILPLVPALFLQFVIGTSYWSLVTSLGFAPSLSATFVAALIQQATTYIGVALTVAALSLAYRNLTAGGPPQVNLTV